MNFDNIRFCFPEETKLYKIDLDQIFFLTPYDVSERQAFRKRGTLYELNGASDYVVVSPLLNPNVYYKFYSFERVFSIDYKVYDDEIYECKPFTSDAELPF